MRNNLFQKYFQGGTLIPKFQTGKKVPIGTQQQYNHVTEIYQSLVDQGIDPQAALDITNQKIAEKGWKGYSTGDNKKFQNADDWAAHVKDWHQRMYPDSLKANGFNSYWRSIQVTPKYKYNSEDPGYRKLLESTRPGVKKRVNFYRQQQGLSPLAQVNIPNNNYNNYV